MWNLKNNTNESMYKTDTDSQRRIKLTDTSYYNKIDKQQRFTV